MRLGMLFAVVFAAGTLSACRTELAASAQANGSRWTTGFWFWNGSSASVTAAVPVDVVYAQVGIIQYEMPMRGQRSFGVYSSSLGKLPPAREYWLVFRCEEPAVPDASVVPRLVLNIDQLIKEARRRKLSVRGIQLDIDSPTAGLSSYGALLRDLRSQLPPDVQLSITTLLDWFRPGTDVDAVMKAVDEFVPQFYDTSDRREAAIAAPIDAAKWGPVFQRIGKPYRIGISSFGRSRFIQRTAGPSMRDSGMSLIAADVTPLHMSMNAAFRVTKSTTAAREVLLRYEATKTTKVGWDSIDVGSGFEFVLPTPESMGAAVRAARSMGGRCLGVLFFRWPSFQETMAAQPNQVLRAAGVLARSEGEPAKVHVLDKRCAAVSCADVYLTDAEPLSADPLRYEIRTSVPLEYVIPAENMPVRMSGSDTIEVSLPPFTGRSRIYVGRAVTADRAEFRLGEVKP